MREEVFKGKLSGLDAIIEKDEDGTFWLKTTQKEDYVGDIEKVESDTVFLGYVPAGSEIHYEFKNKGDLKKQLIDAGYAEKEIVEFMKLWNI